MPRCDARPVDRKRDQHRSGSLLHLRARPFPELGVAALRWRRQPGGALACSCNCGFSAGPATAWRSEHSTSIRSSRDDEYGPVVRRAVGQGLIQI